LPSRTPAPWGGGGSARDSLPLLHTPVQKEGMGRMPIPSFWTESPPSHSGEEIGVGTPAPPYRLICLKKPGVFSSRSNR